MNPDDLDDLFALELELEDEGRVAASTILWCVLLAVVIVFVFVRI